MTQKAATGPADPAAAELVDTRWQLRKAGETEIDPKEDAAPPYFQLVEGQNLVQGFGGCNNFRGSYRSQGNSLSFSQVAATMKMCVENMEQEQLFFTLLDGAASFKILGDELHLYDAENKLLGTFEAGQ